VVWAALLTSAEEPRLRIAIIAFVLAALVATELLPLFIEAN